MPLAALFQHLSARLTFARGYTAEHFRLDLGPF